MSFDDLTWIQQNVFSSHWVLLLFTCPMITGMVVRLLHSWSPGQLYIGSMPISESLWRMFQFTHWLCQSILFLCLLYLFLPSGFTLLNGSGKIVGSYDMVMLFQNWWCLGHLPMSLCHFWWGLCNRFLGCFVAFTFLCLDSLL